MTIPEHMGMLKSLKIWHDNSGTGEKKDWFLSKIIVVDREMGNW